MSANSTAAGRLRGSVRSAMRVNIASSPSLTSASTRAGSSGAKTRAVPAIVPSAARSVTPSIPTGRRRCARFSSTGETQIGASPLPAANRRSRSSRIARRASSDRIAAHTGSSRPSPIRRPYPTSVEASAPASSSICADTQHSRPSPS